MTARRRVKVPFRVEEQLRVESLDVEELGPNHFRLIFSPGMVEGIAAGDEFELDETAPYGFRVLKRSGNVVVWFYWPSEDMLRGPAAIDLQRTVERIGGRLDGGGATHLVFTIPVKAGFPAIEKVFKNAEAITPGTTTMFGNVYDPGDGHTPLNWWLPLA